MGKRFTVTPWECSQTGDCCKVISEVVMTKEEAEALRPAVGEEKWATLQWRPGPPSKEGLFIFLSANPCPLLNEDGKCSVYEVRPYNCRRWGCFRPDPTIEPLEQDHEQFGCANARDRINSDRATRRQAELMQRKAMRWALSHGWRA